MKMDDQTPQEKHAEAKENLRRAEARRYRYRSDARGINGHSDERLATDPQYAALVQARNDAQRAVIAADPKRPTPKAKGKK